MKIEKIIVSNIKMTHSVSVEEEFFYMLAHIKGCGYELKNIKIPDTTKIEDCIIVDQNVCKYLIEKVLPKTIVNDFLEIMRDPIFKDDDSYIEETNFNFKIEDAKFEIMCW